MFFKKREYGLCKNMRKDAMPKKHELKRKKERKTMGTLMPAKE
jgi:hypothetical protein